MKKRRQVLAVTLAATMVMGMGLSTVSAYAKDKGGKTKITFTYRDDGSDQSVAPLYQWVTAAYDSWDKKDEVELDVAPITASEGDYFTKIALQLADKGTCPDLVCEDTFQLPNDVAAGYLTDLTDYVKDYDDWNDGKYYDSMKDMVSVDGVPYALPYCTDARGIWYNKEVFEKAGLLDENNEWQPKTWQDILDACAAIKEKCPDVVPFWCNSGKATGEATSMQTYAMLLYGTGEKLLNDDNKWITGSDGIKNSLNFLNDIYSNGYGPSLSLVLNGQAGNTSAREYMPQGKLGMSIDGIWITGNWKDTGASPWEDYQDKVGLAAMPTNEGQDPGTVTMSGGWALSIPENADNKDLTFDFMEHMMSPEVYLKTILDQGNICTRTDVAEEADYVAQPFFEKATSFLDTAYFRPQNDQYSSVSTYIQSMVESVVSGTSVEDAMKQYNTDVSRTVSEDNVAEQ